MLRASAVAPALVGIVVGSAACGAAIGNPDVASAVDRADPGTPVLSMHWQREVADTRRDTSPQEFASPAVYLAASSAEDRIYVGSRSGWFFAMGAKTGEVIWKRNIGSVSSRPLLDRGYVYVGTDDGFLICMDLTGEEKWRYQTRGPILESPILADDAILVANEADQVYSLDRRTGKFRWQYKGEAPEEYTLRGHSGLAVSGELAFVGFANGTLVALRTATGSIAWLSSLKGEEERFVDVDTTPLVLDGMVLAASSTGGLHALDETTGRILWRLPVTGGGGVTADEERIYFLAANAGVHCLDRAGNVLWRIGTNGGGEPARPVVQGDYLYVSLARSGLYVANKRSGKIAQYFDPGYGVSSEPTLARQRLYVLSNGSVLYSLSVESSE